MLDTSARGPRTALVAIGVVLALAVGFAVGRATTDSSAHAGTNAAAASDPRSESDSVTASTTTTLPPLNVDELAENKPDQPLDPATRAKLAADLEVARSAALQYPTVASATAAHMLQAGKFAPELGAHYVTYANVGPEIRSDGSVDPSHPGSFIYDGVSPDSRLVGLMYISLADNAPAGFPGPNDHWHRHSNLCIQYGRGPGGSIAVPFAPDRDVTRAQCDAVHGTFMKKTVWMVHAWVVPGWESPKGVFSHENPDLTCADGTVKTDKVGFCKGT
jgi:hypothetical protein